LGRKGRSPQQAQRLEFERKRLEVHSKLRDSNLRGRGRGPQQAQRLEFERERKQFTASSETRI
jgi:hypothetical protein